MTDTDNSAIAELQRRFETLHGKLDIHLALQKAIFERLAPAQRFSEVIPGAHQRPIPRDRRGVIRFIHNPSAQDVQVTLYNGENENATPRFNALLAPGESRPVFVTFNAGMTAGSGSGCTIDGEYDA